MGAFPCSLKLLRARVAREILRKPSQTLVSLTACEEGLKNDQCNAQSSANNPARSIHCCDARTNHLDSVACSLNRGPTLSNRKNEAYRSQPPSSNWLARTKTPVTCTLAPSAHWLFSQPSVKWHNGLGGRAGTAVPQGTVCELPNPLSFLSAEGPASRPSP